MGETAEEIAALDGLTREECDAFSLHSHQRTADARDGGRFDREIVPVSKASRCRSSGSILGAASELAPDTQLVVEAVPERPDLKATVLKAAEDAVGTDTVLATNTSSLSGHGPGQGPEPPRPIPGDALLQPVPASKLVEVVVAGRTDPTLTEMAVAWVRGIGKTGIVVQDRPGFASSRLGVLLGPRDDSDAGRGRRRRRGHRHRHGTHLTRPRILTGRRPAQPAMGDQPR
jgi:hypothetical protein